MPAVSVVVPVRNRRGLLAELLNALDKQTERDFEVVIVDDHSTDGSAEEASGRVIAGRPVVVVKARESGAVAARAQGVEVSQGSILAFTDSDCVPGPGWLAAGVRAIDNGADVVNGATRPTRPPRPGERTMWSGDEALYPTCNLFFRRTAFEAAGGFDRGAGVRLGFRPGRRAKGLGFGEDTLAAWSVRRKGKSAYAPDAVVEHHVLRPSIGEALSRASMAAAFPALVNEVPELRSTLVFHGFQLGRRSRLPFYATLAAVLLQRRLAGFALSAWAAYAISQSRPAAYRDRLRSLPLDMLTDAATGVALLAGSIRARRILL